MLLELSENKIVLKIHDVQLGSIILNKAKGNQVVQQEKQGIQQLQFVVEDHKEYLMNCLYQLMMKDEQGGFFPIQKNNIIQ